MSAVVWLGKLTQQTGAPYASKAGLPIAYASSPLAPVPVTSIPGVRFAFSTPGVHFSAARSFGLATVSFGSAAPAEPARTSEAARTEAATSARRSGMPARYPESKLNQQVDNRVDRVYSQPYG